MPTITIEKTASPKEIEIIKSKMIISYSTKENTKEKRKKLTRRALLVSILKSWRP